ncbi:MAG: hypothetical protein KZQ81_07065 [Candidatus Thiodiazotropha sp. (ex Rostrolucina anterorostrata)]|nr:hypothetical protein [Candidatus Thiodiazotropha sp. (ex Rostrolucina anterorostrata)]
MKLVRLNSGDHFTLMMDHEIRKSGFAGNFCAIGLQLQGVPDLLELEQRCNRFSKRFPRAVARLQPHGRQYTWRMAPSLSLPFQHHDLRSKGEDTAYSQMEEIINRRSLPVESPPVEIHLIQQESSSWLMLRWYHPACDAKGAELIIHHLFQDDSTEPANSDSLVEKILQDWGWWRKIRLGFQAKRYIDRLDRYNSVMPIPEAIDTSGKSVGAGVNGELAVFIEEFAIESSTRILLNARKATGMTGTALYFIGCMMRALQRLDEDVEGEAFLVPYAVNFRRNRAIYPVFGNQVSFLFLQAERHIVRSREKLFAQLKEQNRVAITQRQDLAMLPLMQAASWLTLEKHGGMVRQTPKGRERSSFWFSYTGGMAPAQNEILGCPIISMTQMSQVTAHPALGLLVNNFQGRLILSLNYAKGRFSREWIQRLVSMLGSELVAEECE